MTTPAWQRVADATPATRNRVVDFLRAAAIVVVVFGHWTIVAVSVSHGELFSAHALLDTASWTHPITWFAQVMPVFFFVGGYSNALSWRSARAKGLPYSSWLRARLRRLGLPLIPLLITWTIAASVALALGVPADTLRHASQVALIPTWFLAAYVLVVAVAPFCLVLWERFGMLSVAVGLALGGLVDLISISVGNIYLGYPNYLLVWASVHQLGYAWLDGRLAGRARRLALFCVGLAGLSLLVGFGPYPVSMIGLEGAAVNNSAPTRITMAFLGMAQIGLVLLAEDRLARWLQRPRVWYAVVVVNLRIMSWYLWHLTAMVAVVGVSLLLLGGFGLHYEPMSGAWWATRPVWLAVLATVTFGIVTLVGRFESPAPDHRPAPATWRPVAATVCLCAGLAVMASVGIVNANGVTWVWPLLPVLGMVAFGVVQLPAGRKSGASASQGVGDVGGTLAEPSQHVGDHRQ